ncbi:MAG TPA: hypothetical protein VJZ32_11120 [Candidatus Bathyarchaeia archaeon]|nr:hypothetical protein [Candidatus Bathyarchaeia archaeon]HKM78723.1 hypothetical protein [Candidatus Bathyarchaeia archaeon]
MKCKECGQEMRDYGATRMQIQNADALTLHVFCCEKEDCGHTAFKYETMGATFKREMAKNPYSRRKEGKSRHGRQ